MTLRYSERQIRDKAHAILADPERYGTMTASLAVDLLEVLERIGRLRDKPEAAPVILRTPDGIPDGWYVTVEHDQRNPLAATVLLHRPKPSDPLEDTQATRETGS